MGSQEACSICQCPFKEGGPKKTTFPCLYNCSVCCICTILQQLSVCITAKNRQYSYTDREKASQLMTMGGAYASVRIYLLWDGRWQFHLYKHCYSRTSRIHTPCKRPIEPTAPLVPATPTLYHVLYFCILTRASSLNNGQSSPLTHFCDVTLPHCEVYLPDSPHEDQFLGSCVGSPRLSFSFIFLQLPAEALRILIFVAFSVPSFKYCCCHDCPLVHVLRISLWLPDVAVRILTFVASRNLFFSLQRLFWNQTRTTRGLRPVISTSCSFIRASGRGFALQWVIVAYFPGQCHDFALIIEGWVCSVSFTLL